MRLMLKIALSALAALGLAAGSATAQDLSHQLQDGRTLTVMAETPCGAPRREDDARMAFLVTFTCLDDVSGLAGEGFFAVGAQPGETTPREYLLAIAEEYWPERSAEAREAEIIPATATGMSGSFAVLCVLAADAEQARGEATCVVDHPRTQVIMQGRSSGAEAALGVLTMFISGVSVR
jgi:hypothetical protein